ncbi:MAG: hypothetical protein ACLP4V_30365 [Methylocella sp.]
MRHRKERGRLRCHKRPKSREETPKEGIGGNNLAALQQYAPATHKTQVMLTNFLGKADMILAICFFFVFSDT